MASANDRVSFCWRDYAHGGKNRITTVSADDVLPNGLVRIRHLGLSANRRRETAFARCRQLLGAVACADTLTSQPRCPACSGTMLVIERMTSASAQLYSRLNLPHLPGRS